MFKRSKKKDEASNKSSIAEEETSENEEKKENGQKESKRKDGSSKEKKGDSLKEDRKNASGKKDKDKKDKDKSKKERERDRAKSRADLKEHEGSALSKKQSMATMRRVNTSKAEQPETTPDETYNLARMIRNPTYADITFVAAAQKIPAHLCILQARVGEEMVKNPRKKKNIIEVDVPAGVSGETFLELLQYIYTGDVEFGKRSEDQVILILSALTHYEDRGWDLLRWRCEHFLRERVDTSNVHKTLKTVDAHKLSFKDYILAYCVEHYSDFIANKAATKELGIDLLQDVVALQQQGDSKIPPESPSPTDNFRKDLKSLYESSKNIDINFKLAEANMMGISGTVYKGHKAIIVGRAPLMDSILTQPTIEVSKNQTGVPMKGISAEAFEALLKWIYFAERSVPTLAACELIPFCSKYQLFGLLKVCIENMRSGIHSETVLTILDVSQNKETPSFFIDAMKELKPKCIAYCVENLKEIDLEKIREKKLSRTIAPDILIALQKS